MQWRYAEIAAMAEKVPKAFLVLPDAVTENQIQSHTRGRLHAIGSLMRALLLYRQPSSHAGRRPALLHAAWDAGQRWAVLRDGGVRAAVQAAAAGIVLHINSRHRRPPALRTHCQSNMPAFQGGHAADQPAN